MFVGCCIFSYCSRPPTSPYSFFYEPSSFLLVFFLLLRERLTLMRIDLRCLAMQHRVSLLRVQLLWNFICVGHTHIKWFDLMCLRFFRRNEIAKKQKLCVGFFTVLCDSNDYYIRWLNRFLHTIEANSRQLNTGVSHAFYLFDYWLHYSIWIIRLPTHRNTRY